MTLNRKDLKEKIMDILMNYLPKNGVSKTRDELLTLYTEMVEGELLEFVRTSTAYNKGKRALINEAKQYLSERTK